MDFVSSTTGWAAGDGGTFLMTTNGGTDWTSDSVGSNSFVIFDIDFYNEDIGYAVTLDSIWSTIDGGQNWTMESYSSSVSGPLWNRGVVAPTDSTAFVAGKSNRVQNTDATVFDNITGGSGDFIPDGVNSFDVNDELYSIAFSSNSIGYVGGLTGKLYRMESDEVNYGGPWELNFTTSDSQSIIKSISFANLNNGMFIHNTADANGTVVYLTNNGGDNWSTDPDTIPDFRSNRMDMPTSVKAWIVGDAGGIYSGVDATVSINELKNKMYSIIVSPNPFSESISIDLSTIVNEKVQVLILNVLGQTIKHYNIDSGETQFRINDLGDLKKGTYFINIINAKNKIIAVEKIIKQ